MTKKKKSVDLYYLNDKPIESVSSPWDLKDLKIFEMRYEIIELTEKESELLKESARKTMEEKGLRALVGGISSINATTVVSDGFKINFLPEKHLRIECEEHPIQYWLENYHEIAIKHGVDEGTVNRLSALLIPIIERMM